MPTTPGRKPDGQGPLPYLDSRTVLGLSIAVAMGVFLIGAVPGIIHAVDADHEPSSAYATAASATTTSTRTTPYRYPTPTPPFRTTSEMPSTFSTTRPQTTSPLPPAPSRSAYTPAPSAATMISCDPGAQTLAVGRTAESAVAICGQTSGALLYRGLRLSDGARIDIPGVVREGDAFVVFNEGVQYRVSPTALAITKGETQLALEYMIEFSHR